MNKDFEGCCAVVTGAGSGNGRCIANAFAAAGARVVCSDRNLAAAVETVAAIKAAGGHAVAVEADISVAADCQRTIAQAREHFGAVDILVNNAGILPRGGVKDITEADWDRAYAVNVKGAFLMTQAAVDDLCVQKGNIVMVASVAGIRGVGSHLAYSSSKHAVVGMTRSLALELGPKGVRVNAIAPGTIETPMMTYPGSNLKARGDKFPLQRIGQPEEVAKVVLHLASSDADWTTGLIYVMDGGRTLM
jgi:NAD(P)-dependent dehydrogenase (short-subunit alcohol dehydrogenase family)